MHFKNFFILVLFLSISYTTIGQTAITPQGSGTSTDPYLMSSLGNLYWLASENANGNKFSLSKFFLQTNNIDASDTRNWTHTWIPIGGRNSVTPSDTSDETGTNSDYCFYGTYNGGGYAVDGLVFVNNLRLHSLQGFFGLAGPGSVIVNLNITNVSITTNSEKTGGLVGLLYGGTIYNCSTTGIINSTNQTVGGLVGQIQGSTTKNSSSSCTVTGLGSVAGLAGINQGTIIDCFSTGNVTGDTNSNTGGLMGQASNGAYYRSYSNNPISTTKNPSSPGGFAGIIRASTANNSFCYWNSDNESDGYNSTAGNFTFTPIGLTTSQLKDISNFDSSWDFVQTWAFGSDGFPTLVNLPNTWLGVDTNWTNTANWSFGVLPTTNFPNAKEFVVIPAGLSNYPSLTGNVTAYSVIIDAGASLTTNAFTLTNTFLFNKNLETNTWTGAVNTDWSTLGNWTSNVVLSTYTTVTIPTGLSNYPIISTTNDVIIGSIVIESGASLNIAKGGSLKLSDNFTNNGTVILESDDDEYSSIKVGKLSSGNIEYKRYVNSVTNGWDLIGAPISGEAINLFSITNSSTLATNSTIYAIGTYDNTNDTWTNYTSSTIDAAGNFIAGKGYQMATISGSTLSFSGTIPTADVTIPIQNNDAANSGAGRRWNLISNPFPSYISGNNVADATNNFLTVNSAVLDDNFEAVYGFNGTGYTVYNHTSNSNSAVYIAPAQGFFVAAASTSSANVRFTEAMQTVIGADDFVAAKTVATSYELVLDMHSDAIKVADTKFYFKQGLTLGLDPGYDAGAFNQTKGISSRLVEQDNGIGMGINAMSIDALSSVTVPLVIDQEVGIALKIEIANSTIPQDINVYLEDALENTFTLLLTNSFELTPTTKLSGSGRFYLHFTTSTLSADTVSSTSFLTAYKGIGNTYISVEGLQQFSESALLTLYNVLGTKILSRNIQNPSQKETLSTIGIKAGVYILQLNHNNTVFTKKILID
jgi:hypothetical protein